METPSQRRVVPARWLSFNSATAVKPWRRRSRRDQGRARASFNSPAPPGAAPTSPLATLTGLFALIIVGAYVSQMGAGLAYPDWPLFNGTIVSAGGKLGDIHYAHRMLAVVALQFGHGGEAVET